MLVVSAVELNRAICEFWNALQVDSTFHVGTEGGTICKCKLALQSADLASWDKALKQTGGDNLQYNSGNAVERERSAGAVTFCRPKTG
jgi:hypothetical protein